MELDSVRELKQSLLRSMPRSAHASAIRRGVAASRSVAAAQPRAVALGAAPRARSGYDLAVRVQEESEETREYVETIREKARGEADVRFVGRVAKRALPWHQRENRPLKVGGSVGHVEITAGTLGCFVRRTGGPAMILSNNHVLANENDARKGDAILQPGPDDGGVSPGSVVAKLEKFIRLKTTGVNFVDCAVAVLESGFKFDRRTLQGIGEIAGIARVPPEDGRVAKVGRTTGARKGKITAIELDNVIVEYDLGDIRFDDQIEIEGAGARAFSDGGDSGSLIVTSDGKAFALLFAGSDEGGRNGKGLTYANPLKAVLTALDVKLLR